MGLGPLQRPKTPQLVQHAPRYVCVTLRNNVEHFIKGSKLVNVVDQ